MGNKKKGLNAERELIHLFWATNEWAATRVAGSGSIRYPVPDVIASKQGLTLAIECKFCSEPKKYLSKQEVEELIRYASVAGARALIAVRFSRLPWRFLEPSDLDKTEHSFVVTREKAELKGLTFEELTKSL